MSINLTRHPEHSSQFGKTFKILQFAKHSSLLDSCSLLSLSTSLTYIVFFGLSPQGFTMCLLERGFYTLISNVSFPFPTDVGSHNLPLLRAQRFRHILYFFWAFPQSFKTHLLGRSFHSLISNVSFSSPTDMKSPTDEKSPTSFLQLNKYVVAGQVKNDLLITKPNIT